MRFPYLPVKTSSLPDAFRMSIEGVRLRFTVHYNPEGDFYTITIADSQGDVILSHRPLVYGADLLAGVVDSRLPKGVHIVPFDTAGVRDTVNRATFMADVFAFILVEGSV